MFCVFGYMVAGGFIFNALEREYEKKLRESTRDFLIDFLGEYTRLIFQKL